MTQPGHSNGRRFASKKRDSYYPYLMLFTRRKLFPLALGVLALSFTFALGPSLMPGFAQTPGTDHPELFPLDQVKPGLRGVAYTIFTGDQIEKMDVEVLGVLHNALGPKQDVILIQLHGDKPEHTGVVAGMSGSPVYFEGKLAGALSLKLGIFTKEAIGGVTPISSMLDVVKSSASPADATKLASIPPSVPSPVRIPDEMVHNVGAGSYLAGEFLVPIETPLITTGVYPETLAQFGKQLGAWGMSAMPGGTAEPSPDDVNIKPGDMVGMDLVRGDLSLSPGCTVTTVDNGQILACGHPVFGFGAVAIPLSRAHVVTTLASAMASTKIVSTGGTIGTLTQDRLTAVMGKLGAGPPMIPLDLTLTTPSEEKKFHFEVIESPQLTPLLVAVSAFNGIVSNPAYSEGSTLQLDGTIELENHTPVRLENLFAPLDVPVPSGLMVAASVQSGFTRIYSNPYELPKISRVQLHVTALRERRSATIENAWVEKSEVEPGETVAVKVLLRPYRGEPFIQEIPITVPPQAARGTLQLVVSDAETLNRNVQVFSATQAQLSGLEELIKLANRERRNDRLYASLLQPTPTLLIEDKEMPNAPLSQINVLDQRPNLGGARLLYQSKAGEWSVEMRQVISGERSLPLTIK